MGGSGIAGGVGWRMGWRVCQGVDEIGRGETGGGQDGVYLAVLVEGQMERTAS